MQLSGKNMYDLVILRYRNSPKNAVLYKRVHKHIELHSQEPTKRNKYAEIICGVNMYCVYNTNIVYILVMCVVDVNLYSTLYVAKGR